MKLTNELMDMIDKFEEQFEDVVPLRQISQSVTAEELIESIQRCLKDNTNYLPELYGYANDDGKKTF